MPTPTPDLTALIMGGVAMVGGMAIAAIAIAVSVPWGAKERMAKQEQAHKERVAMIEKGYDPERVFKQTKGAGSDPLLWGCLLAGLGLGVLLGYILYAAMGWNKEVMTNGLGIALGGVGLIVYHRIRKRKGAIN